MRIVVISFLVLTVLSCDYSRVFEQYKPVDKGTWNEDDYKEFKVRITDNSERYNLYFNLRNSNTYKYSNLFVISELQLPTTNIEKDTLQFILCDATGKWLGKNSGSLITHQILFQRNVVFPDTGTYTIKFSQAMRDAQLNGIAEVGLRVEKTQ